MWTDTGSLRGVNTPRRLSHTLESGNLWGHTEGAWDTLDIKTHWGVETPDITHTVDQALPVLHRLGCEHLWCYTDRGVDTFGIVVTEVGIVLWSKK